ncbi:hypothetical protein [Nonomuraea diastatica]|uniref:Uncharacterized protein n=1 Tax=Nonomuraea diastatica TaxID=1848329 RepID=A0A4R4WUM6_9ACTN|nr:hypothetical protein [Nonomuraea diastatica]TDD21335.1 hypothetical protein E1294_15250 [Nonomuraea diastatica]
MTALPEDGWIHSIRPQPSRISAGDYEKFQEEISRAIEIVDGYVVCCEPPAPGHQIAGRRLANLLERHRGQAMSRRHECLTVANDVDLRLRDAPLLNHRPGVVMYQCLNDERDETTRPSRAAGLATRVRGLVAIATGHRGVSPLATFGSANPGSGSMRIPLADQTPKPGPDVLGVLGKPAREMTG